MVGEYFTQNTFQFLHELSANNNREWFNENKQLYEDQVRTPALDFIADMSYDLAKISHHFLAVPKKAGGSLMRVNRDIRFGKDKRPYKTNVGIQFRHVLGKDVHAPGFYVHIEPEGCFIGVGIWRPDSPSLAKIRERIVEKSGEWLNVTKDKKFNNIYTFSGESLKKPPRGYSKEHPLLEDLKRKDFIAIHIIEDIDVCSTHFKKDAVNCFRAAEPLMKFLCKALELNY